MSFPTLVSNTPIGADGGVGAAIFTGLDLSNCSLAIVWVGFLKGGAPGTLSINVGAGWIAGPATLTDGAVYSTRVFYKFAPTNNETLSIANSTGGALTSWSSRLFRVSGASQIALAGILGTDPPPVDAGAAWDLLTIAAGGARAVTPWTAGPAGYSAFDYDATGILGNGFADTTAHAQTMDPGAFTGGGVNRRDAWTISLWSDVDVGIDPASIFTRPANDPFTGQATGEFTGRASGLTFPGQGSPRIFAGGRR